MKIRLLKDARITHKAGEIVEVVSPDELIFLTSTRQAEVLGTAAPEVPEAAVQRQTRKAKAGKK